MWGLAQISTSLGQVTIYLPMIVLAVQTMRCDDTHHADLVTTLYHRVLGGLEPPMGDAEYLAAFRTIVLPVARCALS